MISPQRHLYFIIAHYQSTASCRRIRPTPSACRASLLKQATTCPAQKIQHNPTAHPAWVQSVSSNRLSVLPPEWLLIFSLRLAPFESPARARSPAAANHLRDICCANSSPARRALATSAQQ